MAKEMAEVDSTMKDKITLKLCFNRFGLIIISLPSISLAVCLVTAVFFRYDRITETSCNVTNSVPSASAVTGVTPQNYIWRLGIALHSTPRFAVGVMYLRLYQRKTPLHEASRFIYTILYKLIFFFYNVELSSLILVSFISNVENYPLHEKLFISFMVSAVAYQLFTLAIFHLAFPDLHHNKAAQHSYTRKKRAFCLMVTFTFILLLAFFLHRFYCLSGAFSVFAAAEYLIVACVIFFHYSAVDDFQHSSISVEFALACDKSH